MKRFFLLMLVSILTLTLVACNTDQSSNDNVLVVGMEADYPPFNWMETSNNDYNHPLEGLRGSFVAGYDVEVARLIAAELNMDLVIKMIAWEALEPALESGQIDLIIAGMTPTKARRERIDFTNEYYTVENVIVAKSSSDLANMTELSDLANFKGIGQLNTVYETIINYLATNFNSNVINSLDTTPQIVNAVLSGVADFTVLERPVAMQVIAANSNLEIVYTPTGNVFELSDDDLILSIGVKQGRGDFVTLVNEALATISNETRRELMDTASLRSVE